MTPLDDFLAEAEARLSKEPETDFQHEFLPDLERQAPLSVREAKKMLAILRVFAAVVEEARVMQDHDGAGRRHGRAGIAVRDIRAEGGDEVSRYELRPEVEAFAQAMECALRANDHKPGWKNDAPSALIDRLYQEVRELDRTPMAAPDAVLKEAADVANFAMMVADVCGGLRRATRAGGRRREQMRR